MPFRCGINPADLYHQNNYCIVVFDDGNVRWSVIQFEPRVERMERVMEEHTQVIGGLREAVASLDQRVQGLDQRVGRLEDRVGRVEDKMDRGFERIDHRFDVMDEKMSRQFRWHTGILLSGLIAMIGTLGGIIAVIIRQA
ncbi:MAG: hypothetical protein ABIP90_08945 [Vicinamibacterales bacterium]